MEKFYRLWTFQKLIFLVEISKISKILEKNKKSIEGGAPALRVIRAGAPERLSPQRLTSDMPPVQESGCALVGRLRPVSAKNHPAPGVALAVLLTTFPAFRTELRFFGGSCGLAKKCRGKKVGQ